MTCQDLRSYYENRLRGGTRTGADSAEVAAHLVTCADCGRFVEAQQEMETNLRLVRESAPQPSAALDATVLTNYRKQAEEWLVSAGATPARRQPSVGVLRWSGGLAAVVLVAAVLFLSRKNPPTMVTQSPAAPLAAVSQPTDTSHREENHSLVTTREVPHPAAYRARNRRPVPSAATLVNPIPVGFRSLMYCDELSCSGSMEMIRVQLPSSAAFASTSTQTNSVVLADVLVGPDGIARGIRIVE
jgi:hypothetical protein